MIVRIGVLLGTLIVPIRMQKRPILRYNQTRLRLYVNYTSISQKFYHVTTGFLRPPRVPSCRGEGGKKNWNLFPAPFLWLVFLPLSDPKEDKKNQKEKRKEKMTG